MTNCKNNNNVDSKQNFSKKFNKKEIPWPFIQFFCLSDGYKYNLPKFIQFQ